jgi:hypothetical protein
MNTDDDIKEQMNKDFEDYKKKMAEGTYPEAEFVEEDVRRLKEKHPDTPEEALRKLSVAAIASRKRLKQWSRSCATEDMAEPMIKKLFSGDLECVDSLSPIPTLDDDEEDEEETKRKVHELEHHEKEIEKDIEQQKEREKQFEEMERLVESIARLRAARKKKQQQLEETTMITDEQKKKQHMNEQEQQNQPEDLNDELRRYWYARDRRAARTAKKWWLQPKYLEGLVFLVVLISLLIVSARVIRLKKPNSARRTSFDRQTFQWT